MSIWGKLAAATADITIASPIADLLGGNTASDISNSHYQDGPGNQLPFTVGVIVLSAKMAKADGSVTADEVAAFKEAFNVSAAEMKQAASIYNLSKLDMTGYEPCAEQLVTVFKGNRKLLEDVLEGLFHIAKADDEVHPQEEKFLGNVAKRFGFTDTEFSYIKARHVGANRNPYDVLGIQPSISDDELKSHFNMLVADNQPDKIIARGVPREFVNIATERLATLTDAYHAIVEERSS